MTNPFDDADAQFVVLMNDEEQRSLWPTFADVPAGWTRTFGPAGRQDCLDHINAVWTDMRPASLVRRMENAGR